MFPKAILQVEFAANAPMRERMAINRECLRAKRAAAKRASEKGAARWREPPRRRRVMRVKSGISPMAA